MTWLWDEVKVSFITVGLMWGFKFKCPQCGVKVTRHTVVRHALVEHGEAI